MRHRVLILALLVLLPLLAFGGVLHHRFVGWDDDVLIYQNPHLHPATADSYWYFWRHGYDRLYVPLTYGAYALLAMAAPHAPQASGATDPNPFLFHLLNLLLHLGNTLLVFAVLRRLSKNGWGAAIGALLFALHPVQVEAVAWASELKGLLSAFFALLALLLYLRFADSEHAHHSQTPAGSGPRFLPPAKGESKRGLGSALSTKDSSSFPGHRLWNYVLATICFALGLLAKPSIVTLPLVAWCLDCWVLGRPAKKAAFALWPWVAIGTPWVLVTEHFQPVTDAIIRVPLWQRPFVAGDALAFYLGKLAWPVHLAPDYGRTPNWVLAQPWHWFIWLVPAGLLALAAAQIRKRPYLTAAAGIVLAALLPVLGLAPFHFQLYSTVADRYLYLALLGPALAGAMLVPREPKSPWPVALGLLAVCCLGILAHRQNAYWRDSKSLFTHTLSINPGSWMAINNLGATYGSENKPWLALQEFQSAQALIPTNPKIALNIGQTLERMGKLDDAIASYHQGLALDPDSPEGHNMLGVALGKKKQWPAARAEFETALRLQPDMTDAHLNLGMAAENLNDRATAEAQYRAAIAAQPTNATAHNKLGALLATRGDMAGASTEFSAAIAADPKLASAHRNLGAALEGLGKGPEAMGEFQKAVSLDPDDAQAHYYLGVTWNGAGNPAAAIPELRAAVRLRPDFAEAYNDLGTALAKVGQAQEGEAQLRKAISLKPQYAEAHFNLGQLLLGRHKAAQALSEFQQVLEIDPRFPGIRDALNQASRQAMHEGNGVFTFST